MLLTYHARGIWDSACCCYNVIHGWHTPLITTGMTISTVFVPTVIAEHNIGTLVFVGILLGIPIILIVVILSSSQTKVCKKRCCQQGYMIRLCLYQIWKRLNSATPLRSRSDVRPEGAEGRRAKFGQIQGGCDPPPPPNFPTLASQLRGLFHALTPRVWKQKKGFTGKLSPPLENSRTRPWRYRQNTEHIISLWWSWNYESHGHMPACHIVMSTSDTSLTRQKSHPRSANVAPAEVSDINSLSCPGISMGGGGINFQPMKISDKCFFILKWGYYAFIFLNSRGRGMIHASISLDARLSTTI